ncbi:baseplate J/gp47 family protein [Aureimonas leprariae]|uniref:Baseplate protein J-like barrel domain-containing protein n=1 Tax=Plantimonas leprariae TaxID=2615207 RepID=A0A7V7PRM4_9HYPH|nr:baseplate J/gp47 family protein [Aureimonas leprariae]KAB0681338.1 hypothetical protein F6X38_05485 [Aureimonas leprariae]
MPLPLPSLDDRTSEGLKLEALDLIKKRSPAWNDFSPGDPGVILLELFAFLTQTMLHRLNRVPEKVHVALLNLLGVSPLPPAAAVVTLAFSREEERVGKAVTIPAGTKVSDTSNAVTFETVADLTLATGATSGTVTAIHAESVVAEPVGSGTALPAQSVRLRRAPVIRDLPDRPALVVAVEEDDVALTPELTATDVDGKAFVRWREVTSFLDRAESDRVYAVDRTTGTITFAPLGGSGAATLAAVPGKGRTIRAWYSVGGGRAGNVLPEKLTVMKPPIPGLSVTNPGQATGGEDGETLDQAIARGREAVQVVASAVTARDFERVALMAGGIARARAQAQRELWSFGEPGVVEVAVVPAIGPGARPDLATLGAHQTPHLVERVEAALARHKPIGVRTLARYTRLRPVSIIARIVVSALEDPAAVEARIAARLDRLLDPTRGWPFGKTLRASNVYDEILAEPGIRYAERLAFRIDEGPERSVSDLMRDPTQPRTFYAAADRKLFRSLDHGESWTAVLSEADEDVTTIRANPERPGFLMALSAAQGADSVSVKVSVDGGERWTVAEAIQNERIYDVASLEAGSRTTLLYAGRKGLHLLDFGSQQVSLLVTEVGPDGKESLKEGLYSVAAQRHAIGIAMVAIARREKRGVLISRQGGGPESFEPVPGAEGRDVRRLLFDREGERTWLYAILAAESGADGEGVIRIEARADGIDPAGWQPVGRAWNGGSCTGLAIGRNLIAASSNRAGILTLDTTRVDADWLPSALASGLPITEERKVLAPLAGVALSADSALTLAASTEGIYARPFATARFEPTGRTIYADRAPLPPNALYCAGEHELTVVGENDLPEE